MDLLTTVAEILGAKVFNQSESSGLNGLARAILEQHYDDKENGRHDATIDPLTHTAFLDALEEHGIPRNTTTHPSSWAVFRGAHNSDHPMNVPYLAASLLHSREQMARLNHRPESLAPRDLPGTNGGYRWYATSNQGDGPRVPAEHVPFMPPSSSSSHNLYHNSTAKYYPAEGEARLAYHVGHRLWREQIEGGQQS